MDSAKDCGACGRALGVLRDVQRAHHRRLQRAGRPQAWVDDLIAQNNLLVTTVEELEAEVTTRLLEKRKHAEIEMELRAEAAVLRTRLARKDADLRGLLEVLRRLREFDFYAIEGIHFNEVTESDIFGPVLWQQSRFEQGDITCANLPEDSKKQRKFNKL